LVDQKKILHIQRAGADHTYFDMGSAKWAEAETLVGKNEDEMWKINKESPNSNMHNYLIYY
jgi:hypothetical protein